MLFGSSMHAAEASFVLFLCLAITATHFSFMHLEPTGVSKVSLMNQSTLQGKLLGSVCSSSISIHKFSTGTFCANVTACGRAGIPWHLRYGWNLDPMVSHPCLELFRFPVPVGANYGREARIGRLLPYHFRLDLTLCTVLPSRCRGVLLNPDAASARRSQNAGKRILYYSNHVATFRAQLGKSRLAGDIELNPGPGTNHCKVSLYYQNVRSLKNKLDDYKSSLCVNIESNNYQVVCLSETWLNEHVLDDELSFTDCAMYRRDRNDNRRGGGLLTLVNNAIISRRLHEFENDACELMWIELGVSSRKKCIVGLYYRPPNASMDSLNLLQQSLESILVQYNSHDVLLLGDFNLPDFEWYKDGTYLLT